MAEGVTESYVYDGGSYGKGRLSSVGNSLSGTTSYSYNGAGELTPQTADIVNVSYTTRWTYDAAGRMTNVTYPNSLYLRYNYDSSGRVSGIDRQNGSSWVSVVGTVLYRPATNLRYAWKNG